MKRQVSLSITRYPDDTIRLIIKDKASDIACLELTLPLTQFVQVITGLMTECEATFRGLDRIGKRHEHKKVRVRCQFDGVYDDKRRRQTAAAAIAPFEVDGWRGCVDDALNMHHFVSQNKAGHLYRIGFDRWVPDKSVEEVRDDQ